MNLLALVKRAPHVQALWAERSRLMEIQGCVVDDFHTIQGSAQAEVATMQAIERALEERLAPQGMPLAVVLPGGRRLGHAQPQVTMYLHELAPLAHIATGQVGRVAQDYVEGRLDFDGSVRNLMHMAAQLTGDKPIAGDAVLPSAWWRHIVRAARSRSRHHAEADAKQVQFHYDVSDTFYDLWLDTRKVYSCAYWREANMTLEGAQAAKLDHICRKLMLREGERFLDIGAGWGGLLLWAAEQYGVRSHGITLSMNQH